jgi:hypothetical protein
MAEASNHHLVRGRAADAAPNSTAFGEAPPSQDLPDAQQSWRLLDEPRWQLLRSLTGRTDSAGAFFTDFALSLIEAT